jgi:hypothetical protein
MRYLAAYNHHIPQRALEHRTPVQAIEEWMLKKPDSIRFVPVYDQADLDRFIVAPVQQQGYARHGEPASSASTIRDTRTRSIREPDGRRRAICRPTRSRIAAEPEQARGTPLARKPSSRGKPSAIAPMDAPASWYARHPESFVTEAWKQTERDTGFRFFRSQILTTRNSKQA